MRKNNPIYKRALMLAVPMMIQNGITNMVSLVDNIMMGSQGTEAMTAVSIAGQLIFVFNLAISAHSPDRASTAHNITDSAICTAFKVHSASSCGSAPPVSSADCWYSCWETRR